MLDENILEELEILYSNIEDIEYVVVGGIATILYGVARVTQDSDIVVSVKDINKFIDRMILLKYTDIYDAKTKDYICKIDEIDYDFVSTYEGTLRFKSKNKILWIDLMLPETNLFFKMLYMYSIKVKVGNTYIRIANIDDLIRLKRQSDRARDKEDALELIKLKQI